MTTNKPYLWLMLATLCGLLYLAVAQFGFGYTGFPLDDAWIHQTYARNIGWHGEFAFTPGVPSAGSTAPLWSLLLGLGYALHVPYLLWTYGLGIILLGLSGFTMYRLARQIFSGNNRLAIITGLAVVAEWHLIWAAVSGMETILFVWLSILLVERFTALPANYSRRDLLGLGLWGGLLTLTRPEGVGLAGLVGLMILLTNRQSAGIPKRLINIAAMGAGVLIPLIPYLAFNYHLTGLFLPNTFYAKQQEYAVLLAQIPLWRRWLNALGITLIGGQAVLLPGLLWGLWILFKRKNSVLVIALVWWIGYLTLYAIRLPVTYQHGRYQIPTLPWLMLLGVWGTSYLLHPHHQRMIVRVFSRAAIASTGLAMLLFIALGGQAYATDVRIIQTEMVATAHWLEQNTPPDTIIAAHDIGAIGYFSQRPLIDLAGLITPAVIPFIRNEPALLEFSRSQGATYLVTFPNWYPTIVAGLPLVYSTNSLWAIKAGYANMTIYRITGR